MAGASSAKDQSIKLINNLQDISFGEIGLIIGLTWVTIWLVRLLLPYLAERGPSRLRLYLLAAVPIIRLLLLVLAILWIVPIVFNITFQNFLVISGAASVAVGFAFKDYVSSLIAGVVALIERPYRPGDWIKIGDDYGEVRTMGLRAVHVLTADANMIAIPHTKIWTDNISNSNDGAKTLMCVADFYLQPQHDAALMRSALQDIALTSAYLDYTQPVIVVLHEEPWGTHYKLRAYPYDMRDQFVFISDLTVRGKLAISKCGGVEITAPPSLSVT